MNEDKSKIEKVESNTSLQLPILPGFEWELPFYSKEVADVLDPDYQKIKESDPRAAKIFMSTAPIEDIERFFSFIQDNDLSGKITWFFFFNNFHTKFPGWQFWQSAHKETADVDTQRMLTEPLMQVKPDIMDDEEKSEKYAHQSLKDFFNDLIKTLQSHNIDPNTITTLIEKRREAKRTPGLKNIDEKLHRLLLPVYIDLRKQWYNHNDLTG